MSYILLPMQYKATGMSISMAGEQSGFEARRLLSADMREKVYITGEINLVFPRTFSGQPALVYAGDGEVTDLLSGTKGTYIKRTEVATYGIYKRLTLYNQTDDLSHRITASGQLIHLTYGILHQLPEGKMLTTRSTVLKYEKSEVKFNLSGNLSYDGIMNNGPRSSFTLAFEYLSDIEKDKLVDIFKTGRGVLPMWFIDDLNDEATWKLIRMVTMGIKEPYAGYYSVSIEVKEF
jgi:hypothetical protein